LALIGAFRGGIFVPPDLTDGPAGIPDFTTLGFSIGTTGKFGLSLSNFSLQNLTDIGFKNI
jgi:hypothetical protein